MTVVEGWYASPARVSTGACLSSSDFPLHAVVPRAGTVCPAWICPPLRLAQSHPDTPTHHLLRRYAGALHRAAPTRGALPADLLNHLSVGISVNSTAVLLAPATGGGGGDEPVVSGSKTEGALLLMLRGGLGVDYVPVRAASFDASRGDRLFTFSSARKRMTVLLTALENADPVAYTKVRETRPYAYSHRMTLIMTMTTVVTMAVTMAVTIAMTVVMTMIMTLMTTTFPPRPNPWPGRLRGRPGALLVLRSRGRPGPAAHRRRAQGRGGLHRPDGPQRAPHRGARPPHRAPRRRRRGHR